MITEKEGSSILVRVDTDASIRTFNVPASVTLGSLACSRLVLSLQNRPPPKSSQIR